ncbi:MAG: hypothetical protein JNK94_09380 [Hyphomonadaceae bacterium]|nr:hypothetical protein [Hyphomonadaceae bacterium]
MNDSEVVETPATPPEGWLAEHQRATLAGGDPMSTFQGVLVDEIILPQSAADQADPNALVTAATNYAHAMRVAGLFLPGEFAQEAMWSYYAQDFVQQARQGGLEQYFDNRIADPIAVKCARAGLKSMLADPYVEVFDLAARLKQPDAKRARKAAVQAGLRDVRRGLRELDRRFAALEQSEPLAPRHKTWLKSLRKTRIIPDAEAPAYLQRVVAANPLRAQRREQAERLRIERETTDPAHRAVKALCEMAQLKLGGLTTSGAAPMRVLWPEGPDVRAFGWRVDTDRGARMALFYVQGGWSKQRCAVLIEQGQALPLGSLALSKAEYEAIVPALARGK